MSYAAKGERVFLYQDPAHPDCTPPGPKRSDHRLKRFCSTLDKRAWHFCEEVRGRHFHDFMSGSQTCLDTDECHKYVPLEDLIRILMAEKDQLIKELEERLRQCCQGDSADKDRLHGEIAELTEEVNKSRDMLRKAMHKLENIDEIVNENKKLQCRLRCSEERVKYLEEKKKNLESELADLRSKSQIQIDLERAQQMLSVVTAGQSTEMDEAVLQCLAMERDQLQEKVKNLEKELEESKKKEAEIEMLKKQSQSDTLDKEEMSRENECYRKKLASMKCLEKQIQELKKQGRALADKYKREAQKAAEQMNKMCQASKELQGLREERDSLKKRVNELSSYECQYNKLQRKLQRVDAVIAENEALNCKLLALQNLEKENEFLKCRLEAIQEMEINAAGDKERIMQLQCAVADQEEEMKDLLCQIERLTSGRHEEELERLKCELYEKNSKLKLCEEQLAEIPMLEAEIDELRTKLQCCCREFPEKKRGENSYQKVEVRFPATSTGLRMKYKTPGEKCSSVIGIRREEKVELKDKHGSCQEILQAGSRTAYKVTSECSQKKDVMSCEEVHSLLQSSKGIISCVLEDMIEHQKEMEELEHCNRSMKEEIEALKSKVEGSADKDCLLEEIDHLRKTIQEKDAEISRLQSSQGRSGEDVETLKELNRQMKVELAAACEGLKQVANLEKMLEKEHKARCEAENRLRGEGKPPRSEGKSTRSEGQAARSDGQISRSEGQISKSEEPSIRSEGRITSTEGQSVRGESRASAPGRVTEEDPDFDCCKSLQRETDDLKLQIEALNKLTEELRRENELLRELQQPCPDFSKELDEKCALENLLALLQAELDAFKGQKLSDECTALRNELKRVLEQNCQLKALVDCYRQRLDLEIKSNELNQLKLGGEASGRKGAPDRAEISGELEGKEEEGGGGRKGRKGKGEEEAGEEERKGRKGKGGEEGEEGEEEGEGGEGRKRRKGKGVEEEGEEEAGEEEREGRKGKGREGGEEGEEEAGEEERKGRKGKGGEVGEEGEEGEGGIGRKGKAGRGTGETEGGKSDRSTTSSELARKKEEEEKGTGTEGKGGRGTGGTEGKGERGTEGIEGKGERGTEGIEGKGGRGTEGTEGKGGRGTEGTEGKGGRGTEVTEGKGGRGTEGTEGKGGRGTEGTEGKGGRGTEGTEGKGESGRSATSGELAEKEMKEEKSKDEEAAKRGLSPSQAKVISSPSEVAKQSKLTGTGQEKSLADKSTLQSAAGTEKSSCEEELKALRQENANLKTSLAEAEKRLALTGSEAENEMQKELEQLKKEKNTMAQQLEAAGKGADSGAQAKLIDELEQLKKERDNLLKQVAEGGGGKTDAASGTAAAAAEKEKADCMKELEQLKREKETLAKQLADVTEGKAGAADAASGTAAAAAEKEKADCMKELEQLRKEKDDLIQQLANVTGGKAGAADAAPGAAAAADAAPGAAAAADAAPGAAAAADCLKELEQLKRERENNLKELEQLKGEKKDLENRVAEGAAGGLPDKDKTDLLKELEQLKKEKNEMAEQLTTAKALGGGLPADAPADLQERLRQIEADNAEKLRKLMEQHEKELANREKTYNENLNSMKAGYETDIRKLAERHKQSIMRLQELHDDEVQEMNVNYETQLETMQTQSEAAINDVAKGSAAKQRKLAEQHSRDIKEAEEKFHVALDAKESEYLEQLGGLREALTRSKQELEILKKQAKAVGAGDVEKMKAQQARELQKARRASKQKVDAIKKTMEEERRKSTAEVESLKKQLKEQEKGEKVCECKFSKKKPPRVRDPTCPLDFNEVLEKILEEGLDSLTFNEIALVHRKTCCALEGIVMKSETSPLLELEPPIGDGCPHTPLLEADKQQLLSRIFNLENAILEKQRQTQEAITNMEIAIKRERCRLQDVKNSLQNEQQKNFELKQLLTSQTKLQTNLQKERDRLGDQVSLHESLCLEKSKQLDEELRSKKCLELELDQVKRALKQLCMTLDSERRNSDSKQGDQIELMRQKLEQSIHQERRLALQLENETKCRLQLQCQLQTLRQSLKHMVNLPAVESVSRCSQNPLEAKSAKERQNLDQINEKRNKIKSKSPKKYKK